MVTHTHTCTPQYYSISAFYWVRLILLYILTILHKFWDFMETSWSVSVCASASACSIWQKWKWCKTALILFNTARVAVDDGGGGGGVGELKKTLLFRLGFVLI